MEGEPLPAGFEQRVDAYIERARAHDANAYGMGYSLIHEGGDPRHFIEAIEQRFGFLGLQDCLQHSTPEHVVREISRILGAPDMREWAAAISRDAEQYGQRTLANIDAGRQASRSFMGMALILGVSIGYAVGTWLHHSSGAKPHVS